MSGGYHNVPILQIVTSANNLSVFYSLKATYMVSTDKFNLMKGIQIRKALIMSEVPKLV